jgi:hypothetical protein
MIIPDTKDWTWVLRKPCPECGFDAATVEPGKVSVMLRENAAAWHQALTGPGEARRRPEPQVWSPLEYGCHVRDVFKVYDERLRLMLTETDPSYPNWDQDETAVSDHYADQDPQVVAGELVEAAEALAARFAQVEGAAWERTGSRSDGAHFTIDSFARYLIHDPVHHYWDVTGEAPTR